MGERRLTKKWVTLVSVPGAESHTADMTCILRAPQCTGPGAVLGQREP